MKLGNLDGRLILVTPEEKAIDVENVSGGRFGPDPMSAFSNWSDFRAWADDHKSSGTCFDRSELRSPIPRPGQIFAIGVNYRDHGEESGYPPDSSPITFTKFASSLTGPEATVSLPAGNVDWEVEMVVAIGVEGHRIQRQDAWTHIAGLMVGQDLSERLSQLEGAKPQFSLAKSHPGFSPTGPWLTTADEIANPLDLGISCSIGEELMQDSRTAHMIYDLPELVTRLSAVVTLWPGDLIFTGTPAGIGNARKPKRFLKSGEALESTIESLGTMTTRFV